MAASAEPLSAAAITGSFSWAPSAPDQKLQQDFDFTMDVTRFREDPRVTLPYTEDQWTAIDALGLQVDECLKSEDVRLTMGGEPTFVSVDDMEGDEWNVAALGEKKRQISEELLRKLAARYAKGAILHYGQGKQYPGEPLPRWALRCIWRADGQPAWKNMDLFAEETSQGERLAPDGKVFLDAVAQSMGLQDGWVRPAYEDLYYFLHRERKLPVDSALLGTDTLNDTDQRLRLARVLEQGLGEPTGYLFPIGRATVDEKDRLGLWSVASSSGSSAVDSRRRPYGISASSQQPARTRSRRHP